MSIVSNVTRSITKDIAYFISAGIVSVDNYITVGSNGRVATLSDAITLRNTMTHTLLLSTTGTVTGTNSGTIKVQKAITGDSMATWIGREVYVEIGGTGPLIKMFVVDNNELYSQHSFYDDLSDVQFDLYRVNRAAIVLLPGYREELTATHSIPSFTAVTSLGLGTASLYCSGTGTLDISDTNEVVFNGIQTNQAHNFSVGVTLKASNTDAKTCMCDQLSIRNSRLEGGAVDTIILDGKTGTVVIDSTMIDGIWDVFKVGMPARTSITNNPLFRSVAIDGITDIASPFDVSGLGSVVYPGRTLNVRGNTFVSESYYNGTESVTGMTIAADKLFETATISNNLIIAKNYVGNGTVIGMNLSSGGVIDISGNLFDTSNAGATAPVDIWISASTDITVKSDGTNKKVGDAAIAITDPINRYSLYTNLA